MDSIAQPASTETAPTAFCVDTVASTAAGFLRSLNLEHDQLSAPWITITALASGAWIDISPPFGTAVERLDLIGEAAEELGADDAAICYLPSGSAKYSNVTVTGTWAECPITVRTSIATGDLVNVETDRAVAATTGDLGDLIENVAGHYNKAEFHRSEYFGEWLAQERRVEESDDAWHDRAGDARDGAAL